MKKHFTTTRRFSISLSGTSVEVEAQIALCAYTIMRTTDTAGRPVDISLDDLEVFERHVESQIQETTTMALNLETGGQECFTVVSLGEDILAIRNAGGYVLPRHTPTWTEVVEAWHIDREYAEAVESDQPRLAALAGYIQPQPHNAGHGLRRAA